MGRRDLEVTTATLGRVARTLPTSLVDGPGNRFVVFLQGCNFDCFNCHNPHTINLCDACGECLHACAPGALEILDGRMEFLHARCDGCDRCLDACPYDANPMGLARAVPDIIAELEPLAPFLSGITVSGGEPTLQHAFLLELFATIKAHGTLRRLSTFVDSNGTLDARGWEELAPWMDGAMLDVKAVDPDVHRRITGCDNAAVLRSAAVLHRLGRLHEVRLLVIEGLTDADDELARYAAFVGGLDPGVRVRLMAYRHHGVRAAGRAWPETSAETVERVARTLHGHGLRAVVTPAVMEAPTPVTPGDPVRP